MEVIVDNEEHTRVLKVGRNLEQGRFNELVRFLRANLDVFTWRRKDIVGLHPDVICHRMNIDQEKKPIKQNKPAMDSERYNALKDEVDKLLKINFIKEAHYPVWLANPILVKKPNGKWRTCID